MSFSRTQAPVNSFCTNSAPEVSQHYQCPLAMTCVSCSIGSTSCFTDPDSCFNDPKLSCVDPNLSLIDPDCFQGGPTDEILLQNDAPTTPARLIDTIGTGSGISKPIITIFSDSLLLLSPTFNLVLSLFDQKHNVATQRDACSGGLLSIATGDVVRT